MEHRGTGHHRHRGRGRPFKSPCVRQQWNAAGMESVLELYDFELEVLKLIDVDGFTQEEVAQQMKPQDDTLSRGNINRYLQSARKKVVLALLNSERVSLKVINTQQIKID